MSYNPEQIAAITDRRKVVVVAAGPGSGKSHTLVGRVKYRVEHEGVDPQRVVILTFTNNAARVFTERLGRHGIRVGYAGTLHGYCMRLLQAYGALLGYRAGGTITIATEQAKKGMLLQQHGKLYPNMKLSELQARQTREAQLVWNEYEFELKRANMVDFDKILVDGLNLLQRDSVKLLVEIDELLVDERQDSSAIDTSIFWQIPATTRFFVGDVDQCIFAFRGAKPDIFIQEAQQHRYLALEYNYRSDTEICRAANNLILHNQNRVPKRLEPVSKEPGEVRFHLFANDGDEIYGVWAEIKSAGPTLPLKEVAILCRTNKIADKFRETLRGLGLQVAGLRHRRMPDDWHYALSVVGLLVDPANDFHAEAILLTRGHGDKINQWKIQAALENKALATVSLLPNMRPLTLHDAMITLGHLQVGRESMALIHERIKLLPEDSTLSDLLVDLWDQSAPVEQDEEGVTVTTVHNAKGREWDRVFLVAMEEGVFPSKQSLDAFRAGAADSLDAFEAGRKAAEEERRLCFVAITRARHFLYVSWSEHRTAFFTTSEMQPSRFIEEMQQPPISKDELSINTDHACR